MHKLINNTIKTPKGDEMVVIQKDELNQIIEDAIDAAMANTVKQEIADGDGEYLPRDFTMKLLDSDDHPVKLWREYRGLTAKDLATTADITAPMLSAIERKNANAGLSVLIKLAKALKVKIDDLIPKEMMA